MKDLKETLQEIRDANDEWRSTFDAMDEAVALLDADGRVLRCNRAMAEFANKPFSRIIGHDCQEICICIGAHREQCPMVRCRTSLKRESAVFNHAEQWFEVSADPILDKAGQLQRAVHILRNITARKQLETALKVAAARAEDEKAKTESFIEAIGDGISIQDRDFRVLYQNPAQKRLIGDHVGEFCYRAYEKREAQCEGCGVAQVFEDGGTHIVQRSASTDKGLVHVEITNSPLRDAMGNVIAAIEVVRNITERKRAEENLRKNQLQLAESQRIAGIGSWERKLGTNQVIWSDELFRIFGLDPEKVQADFGTLLNLIHPEDRERQKIAVTEAVQNKQPYDTEYRILKPDGSQAMIHAQGEVVCDQTGRPILLRGTAQDITGRKQAEDALRLSEGRYRLLFQKTPIGLFQYNADLRITDCNERFAAILQTSRDKLIGLDMKALRDQRVLEAVRAVFHGVDGRYEGQYITTLSAIEIYISLHTTPIVDQSGLVSGGVGIVDDISERVNSEMRLQEQQRFSERLIQNSAVATFVLDARHRVLIWNRACEAMTGFPASEMVGTKKQWKAFYDHERPVLADIVMEGDSEKASAHYNSVSESLYVSDGLHAEGWYNLDNRQRYIAFDAAPIRDAGGVAIAAVETLQDLTERRKLEEELSRSQKDWEDTFNSITDMVTVHDMDYNIILANKAAEKILGLPLLGKLKDRKCFSYYHGADSAPYGCPSCGCLQSGEPALFEMFEPHLNMYIELRAIPRFNRSGNLIGLIHIVRDITERKKSEAEQERLTREKEHLREQLLQSQKMEAVGTLAGGIAHDFNNILNVIIGYGGLLDTMPDMTEKARQFLSEINMAANRAAYLTRGLLAFSRKQHLELKPANLNEIISSITAMLYRVLGEDIRMNIELCKDNLIIICDTAQVEQIIVNLATNARDAMPRGGLLTIETEIAQIDEKFILLKGFGSPGRYAVIRFTDTGVGMDAETRERIFEPFFTTKAVGKGTGLGLSIIYGIVAQHNGFLECESSPGRGTAFSVYLPLGVVAESADEDREIRADIPKGRGELILIAEDDDPGRRLLRVVLEHQGYRVIEAVNGIEAIEKFREHSQDIALILLDVIMPDMNGCNALDLIFIQSPDTKAILMSGYTADILEQRGIKNLTVPLLKKPVSPHELLKVVRSTLDGE